jgi:hypothetical protein
LEIDTLLGANWGSQTYTYRIREEREGATCQHLIGPPQHVSAMCQHIIGPPHPCGSHISDKWVPLMSHGSQLVVHVSSRFTRHRQVARFDWATSALWPLGSVWVVHCIERECQMAAHREATSACQCHMTVSYWSTSAFTCHMAAQQ